MGEEHYFTEAVARFESLRLKAPALVLLEGDLGLGKTTFVKELLGSWGYSASQVQSPTFLKLLEHRVPGKGLCLHLDCYRIEDLADFDRLALESYLEASFWFVEWPQKLLRYWESHPELERLIGFRDRARLIFSMDANGRRQCQIFKES
jgi:tRNA threonylcarbamoyl adenosine modification protein YjeE